MKKHLLTILLFIPLSTFSIGAIAGAVEDELNQVLNGFHDDAANARFDSYFDRFAEESYFLGTDASERWSVDEFREYAKPSFDAGRGWTYRMVDRNVRISGDTAWFDERLSSDRFGRCRGTGVLVREKGEWKIAHYSLTLLIPNEIAEKVGSLSIAVES